MKIWSRSETTFLQSSFLSCSLAELLAGLPGRSEKEVRSKASRLGLKKGRPKALYYRPVVITLDYLRSVLNYDPLTGIFTWRARVAHKCHVGQIAGNISNKGYIVIAIGGKTLKAHRIAFAFVHNRWPLFDVDHIDRNRNNNRSSNLREANRQENAANSGPRRRNILGLKGVFPSKGQYTASIKINGRKQHLGTFDSEMAAAEAYNLAARKQFGEFAFANGGA